MLRGILFWAFIIVAAPLGFVQPFSGVLAYLFLSHTRMADFVWVGYGVANYALIVAGATLLGYAIFELRRSPPRVAGLRILLAFWVWLLLSSVLAYDATVAMGRFWQYTRMIIMTFLVAAVANSEERIRKLLFVVAGAVGILGAKGAMDFFITAGQYRMRGPGGMLNEENEYALALNMAIPLLIFLARTQTRRWGRWVLLGMAAGCAINVIGTHSRSGFLGLIVAGLLVTFYSRRRLLAVPALVLASALLLVVIAPKEALRRYESIPTAMQNDPSAIGRLEAWDAAWHMTRAHPVFGVGLKNFVAEFPRFSRFTPRAPHNAFMALAAETGLPGCALFTIMVLGGIFGLLRLRRRLQRFGGFDNLAAYCLAIQTSLTVYIAPNMFINRQDQDLMYHLLGIAAGLTIVARQKMAERRAEQAPAKAAIEEPAWAGAEE